MAKSMRVCDARRRSARATSSPPRPRRSPPASSAATWREQMSVDAGAAALEMVRAAGLLRTQGLIGGKWVDGYDGKTVEKSLQPCTPHDPGTGETYERGSW